MFNWLIRLLGWPEKVRKPDVYGGAGGRVPYPPYEVIQERLRSHRILGHNPPPPPGFKRPPAPPPPPRPPNQRFRAGGYVPMLATPVPIREDSVITDLALLALPQGRREPDLNRPSAWPPLDEIVSGGGGDFGGGGASSSD